MIVFLKKYKTTIVDIFVKGISIIVITLSLLIFLPSYSFSFIVLEDGTNISLDLSVVTKDSLPSKNISDFFDISQPFIITETDLDKEINQDLDVLHDFYTYKNHLEKYHEYTQIKNYSLNLLQYYYDKLIKTPSKTSSSSNLFIGIGASPTPIISFWENLKKLDSSHYVLKDEIKTYINSSEFLNIPFSKRIMPEYSFSSLEPRCQQSLYQLKYLELFELLESYSKGIDFTNKNIIILDFAVSGLSIALFTRLFLKYLQYKNTSIASINLHLITILSDNLLMLKLGTLDNVFIDNIYKDYNILSFKLYNSSYDKLAKYNYYNFPPYNMQESLRYKKYSSKIRKTMKKDHDIILKSCPLLFSVLSFFKKG